MNIVRTTHPAGGLTAPGPRVLPQPRPSCPSPGRRKPAHSEKENHVPQTDKQATGALFALAAAAATITTLALAAPALAASDGQTGFGFNAGKISGFPAGAVSLTGGGAFNLDTNFVHSGGGFRCTEGVVGMVPLNGCLAGQGVRWDTEQLLASTGFKCTGAASETRKTATTGDGTVVLQSDFYRAGDGIDESFHAQLIVSQNDIAPDIPGVQNVWVQGVGCGSAIVHFSSLS